MPDRPLFVALAASLSSILAALGTGVKKAFGECSFERLETRQSFRRFCSRLQRRQELDNGLAFDFFLYSNAFPIGTQELIYLARVMPFRKGCLVEVSLLIWAAPPFPVLRPTGPLRAC